MKNQFQDIIPPSKRSIRNIPIPEKTLRRDSTPKLREIPKKLSINRGKDTELEEKILESEKEETAKLSKSEREQEYAGVGQRKAHTPRKILLWLIACAVVVFLFFSILRVFSSATIFVTEKAADASFSGATTFNLNPKESEVGYSSITVSDSATATMPATGEKQTESKATGEIIIYNNFGPSAQALAAGTRFETPAGLIFRLNQSTLVPGQKKQGTKTVPGSITVSVTADKAGSDYNIALSDFTIPGFKGTSKYNTFYARSKVAMSGGNLGKVATVDSTTLAATVKALEDKVKTELLDKASKQLPPTQKTFGNLQSITYSVSQPRLLVEGKDNQAQVKVEGVAKVFAVDTRALARKLLAVDNIKVATSTILDMDFSQVSATFNSESSGVLYATLEGKTTVIWHLDTEAYKKAIIGKSVKDIPSQSAYFEAVQKVSVVQRPFSLFAQDLPTDPKKIFVVVSN